MNSMPAASAISASARLSSQLPDQRSGTVVTSPVPDEQFIAKSPSLNAFGLCSAMRSFREGSANWGLFFYGLTLIEKGRNATENLHFPVKPASPCLMARPSPPFHILHDLSGRRHAKRNASFDR